MPYVADYNELVDTLKDVKRNLEKGLEAHEEEVIETRCQLALDLIIKQLKKAEDIANGIRAEDGNAASSVSER